jgi:FixJ family two-component response regulator
MASAGRVLIVDDDVSVGVAFRRLLVSAGFDVQVFTSGSAFLQRGLDASPSCVILDQCMPDLSGLELQKLISGEQVLSVIFITGHGDISMSVEAMKGGAIDFLTKPVDEERLLAAVNRGLARSAEVGASERERNAFRERVERLTPREREVGELMSRGLLNKQIAWELGTAEKTVKVHRARVLEKLAVSSVAELAMLAERTGVFRDAVTPMEVGSPSDRLADLA